MLDLTLDTLQAVCPQAPASAVQFLPGYLDSCQINTHLRMAAFIAQTAVESDQFRVFVERGGASRPYAPYYGRGILQLTGGRNYVQCGQALGLDLYNCPDLVLQHDEACVAWFWVLAHKCNTFADTGDIDGLSRLINGPLAPPASLQARKDFYLRGLAAFGD